MASFDSLKASVEGLNFQHRILRILEERYPKEVHGKHQAKQFGAALDYSSNIIYQKVNGASPFNVIDAWVLSKNFGYSMDYLLFGTGDPMRVTEVRQKEITQEEMSSEELLKEFKRKCEKQGFAVAGAWLQFKLDA